MRSHSESTLAALDMRPRHLLTLTVLRDLGGCTQQALAAQLSIDRTNLVGLLNELESERLIERRRTPEDRRRHIVEAHPRGSRALAKAEFALAAVEERGPGRARRRAARSALPAAGAGDPRPEGRPALELLMTELEPGLRELRRLHEGDRVPVRIGHLHVALALGVGLDRLVADALGGEPLQ